MGSKKTRDAMLIDRPYFPSVKRLVGNGAPHIRLETRHDIVEIYENWTATLHNALRAFIATDDPMLMSESRMLMTHVTKITRRGIFRLGEM